MRFGLRSLPSEQKREVEVGVEVTPMQEDDIIMNITVHQLYMSYPHLKPIFQNQREEDVIDSLFSSEF